MTTNTGFSKVEGSLRTQSILMTTVRVLRTVLTIGIPIVLVRVLDQADFGAYKQVGLIATTALSILALGLSSSLFYFIPRAPARSQAFILQTAAVFAITSVAGGLALAFNSDLLARFFSPETARYSVWLGIMVGLSITSLLDVLMVVDRRVRLAAVSSAALDLTHGLLVIGAALLSRDLDVVLAVVCVSLLIRVMVLAGYIRWRGKVTPTEPGKWPLLEQFAYALPFYFTTLVAMSRDQLHAFFVATNYDAAQFAIYAIGTIQLPLVGHMTQSIGETIILENSRNFAAGNLAEMQRVWHRATYIVALIMLPLFFVLEFFAADIISVMFGTAYAASASVWRVFVLMLPLSILLGATMLRATGDMKRMITADVISLCVTIATLLALADALGILAAVWSIVLGNATLTLIVAGRAMKRMNTSLSRYLQWRRIGSVALVASASVAAAYYATGTLPQWLRIAAGPALAGIAYLTCTWLTGLIPDSERKLLLQIRDRLGARLGLAK